MSTQNLTKDLFLINNFIYSFILGCAGSLTKSSCVGFSLVVSQGYTLVAVCRLLMSMDSPMENKL